MAATSNKTYAFGTTDVAKACAFLASDDARAITGATLTIDCGMRIATAWMPFGGVRGSRSSR